MMDEEIDYTLFDKQPVGTIQIRNQLRLSLAVRPMTRNQMVKTLKITQTRLNEQLKILSKRNVIDKKWINGTLYYGLTETFRKGGSE